MEFFGWPRPKNGEALTRRRIAQYERKYRLEEPGERPHPLPVEETFDAFVRLFGGDKISDRLQIKAHMPLNADYIFEKDNVIAELKTLEGIFSGPSAMKSFVQAFVDTGHPQSAAWDFLYGQGVIPERTAAKVYTRLRRGLEARITAARKQLRKSREMLGNEHTKLLILFAMDQDPLFGHDTMLGQLTHIMSTNYSDKDTDAVIYFNPNRPTRLNADGMEFSGWYPFYRDDRVNDELSSFINLLGSEWLTYYGAQIGTTNPILGLDSIEEMIPLLRGL